MGSISTTSFEPLMPESVEDRWIEYYSGLETTPYCSGSAVSMPFQIGWVLEPSPVCPPETTREQAAAMAPFTSGAPAAPAQKAPPPTSNSPRTP